MEYAQIAWLQEQMHDSKRLFDSTFHRLLGRWDLTENVFRILLVLHSNPGGMEPAQIAERSNLLRPAVCPALNKLDRQKMILRKERSGDHRRKLITLTEKGKKFIGEVRTECLRIEARALEHFSPDEIKVLAALFSRYTRCLQKEVKADEPAGIGKKSKIVED